MLVATDERQTTTAADLLIEETRRPAKRRMAVFVAVGAGVLSLFGVGMYHVAGGGGSSLAAKPRVAVVAADPKPTVLYRKIETVKIVPHLPVERRTIEIWSAANAPLAYRELLRTTGQPSLEIGAAASHDPKLGALQVVYLYQASNDTIYRTGSYVPPPPRSRPSMSAEQAYRRLIAQPGVHLNGTSSVNGHPVNVIRAPGPPDGGMITVYFEQHTYRPIMTVFQGIDFTLVKRTLAWKTLPATKANLKLTTLTDAHPGARIRPATPRIKALYGLATMFDNVTTDGVSVAP